MKSALKNLVKSSLKQMDIAVTRDSYLRRLEEPKPQNQSEFDLKLLMALPERHAVEFLHALPRSMSQLRQDLFVLSELDFKTGGYFVEFGAADGKNLSNSYLLEKEFQWQGIVAEPARRWHPSVKANRSCHFETDCVWTESNQTLEFNEVDEGEYSTIGAFASSDLHSAKRNARNIYTVNTISLVDLLDKYAAPKMIDYLSIDTEGSEYDILNSFDFDKYDIRIITCEHNYTPAREKLHDLLSHKGYAPKLQEFSQFDDWYVRS